MKKDDLQESLKLVQLQETLKKLQVSEKEIEKLKMLLSENESKINKINEDIVASEKSAREMRAALTAEVAEKHDQVLALRREVQHLEDKLRQADMQTHFKDDIIKELRKEIKIANNKLNFLGLAMSPSSNSHLHAAFNDSGVGLKSTQPVTPDDSHLCSKINDISNSLSKRESNNKDLNVVRISRGTSPHRCVKLKQKSVSENYNVHFEGLSLDNSKHKIEKRTVSCKDVPKEFGRPKMLTKKTALRNFSEKCYSIVESSCGDCIDNLNKK